MVPPASPAFLRLSDGKVLGKPTPATPAELAADHPAADPQAGEPAAHAGRSSRLDAERRRGNQSAGRRRGLRGRRADGPVQRRPTTAASRGASVDPGQPPPSRSTTSGRPAATGGPQPARRRPRLRSLRGPSLLRLRIGFLLIAMVVSVFAARLFQLQGVDAQAYVAKAARRGRRHGDPAGRPAARSPTATASPLAESVDGLMIVADPTLTGEERQRDRHDPRPPPRPGLLRRARAGCASRDTQFQYVARRVPSTAGRAGRRRRSTPRLQGHRHPARPGADLPRPTTSPPTWSAS